MAMKKWDIDLKHSSVTFLVRHMLVSSVRGTFARWSGALEFSEAVPGASTVAISIDANSIDTQVPERDAHLRSIDFLETEKYPFITFRSTTVESIGARQLTVSGDLTIRGVTREVVLDVAYGGRVRDPMGIERIGFSARTAISRKDFGITFNQLLAAGGLMLGDRLEVLIEIEAVDQAATHAAAIRRPSPPAAGAP